MKKKLVLILAAILVLAALCAIHAAAEEKKDNMITYLSDMEWKGAKIYNDAQPSRDENVAGEELWLYDMFFAKGVCLHAMPGENAYIEIDIEGQGYKTFCAYAGTAESEQYNVTMASVRFKFKADGKVVEKTDVLRPDGRPALVTVDVTACKTFRIEMDDGGDGISGDWGALGGALFSTSDNVEELKGALEAGTSPAEENKPDGGAENNGAADAKSAIRPAGGAGCGAAVSAATGAGVLAAGACAAAAAAKKKKQKR